MNRFHNANFFKWVAFVFTVVIELLLGINAFNLVQISTQAAIPEYSFIAPVVAVIAGLGLFSGGMFTFLGTGYAMKAARDYTKYHGAIAWREWLVGSLVFAIVALDVISLVFRMQYLHLSNPVPLFLFFLLLAFIPPVLGVIVDVFVNRPVKAKLSDTIYTLKRDTADELARYVKGMPLSLRLQFLQSGDTSLLQNYVNKQEQEHQMIAERRTNAESERVADPFVTLLEPTL
jgi:hypothetical protein